ncbi:MAG: ComEC/Rec2 family competence protein [Clostridiales Family XIII bacterium]|nr:ComEC/Rec2 family competence protein [Clostridiales Family XIII bacterium]
MSVRRPLCYITLTYALGIACAYIFSISVKAFVIVGILYCAALLLAALYYCGGGGAREFAHDIPLRKTRGSARGRKNQIPGQRILTAVLLGVFLLGGLCSAHELGREDSLARYAISPYNNVENQDMSAANAAGSGEDASDVGSPGGEASGVGSPRGDALGPSAGRMRMPLLRGRVLKVREKDAGYRSLTVSAGGRNILVNVQGEWPGPADVIGRELLFSGIVELPSGRRNPGTFDNALYLKTQGVRVVVKCASSDAMLMNPQPGNLVWDVYGALCRVKYAFLSRVRETMPEEEYGLFAGMMFGGSSEMDEEYYDLFRRNGVAHILSVSGLHVAIVYAFFTMLFGRRRTLPVYLAIAAALICYAAMSSFSPSVVRAVTMILLHLVSRVLRLRYDLLTGTCAAALIMLLLNPLDLLSVGFRLSFLAVLLLSFAMPIADRYIGYRDTRTGGRLSSKDIAERGAGTMPWEKAVKVMIPLLVIQLGMMPVIAYEFNYVSPAGILLNPPVVALAGWILPVGICMLLIGMLPPMHSLFEFAAHGETVMTGLISSLTRLADAIPYGHFNVTSPPAPLLFVFYGLLFFLMSEARVVLLVRRGCKRVLLTCACVALIAAVTFISPFCRQDRSALVFVDVGQGDCLHIRTPDGRNYLVDGGGSIDYEVGGKTLLPYLLKNGVGRLDGVFATHLHTDHWRGLCELSRYIDVGNVYVYEGNRVRIPEIVLPAGASGDGAAASGEDALPGGKVGKDAGSADASGIREGAESYGARDADGREMKIKADADDMVFLAQGDGVMLGRGVRVDVLWPPRDTDATYLQTAEEEAEGGGDENKNSLIMKIDYEGVTALMTGDAGEEAERALIDTYGASGEGISMRSDGNIDARSDAELSGPLDALTLHARILKVGHHGSKYSTTDAFLAAVSPDAAVIQVGKNNFGHPTTDVLDKLRGDDIMILRNDLGGAAMFAIRDGKVIDVKDCGAYIQDN